MIRPNVWGRSLYTLAGYNVDNMDPKSLLLGASAPFAQILDLAEDAIISVDEEQRIVLYNQGAEKIFGHTHEEILGQPLEVLLPEQYRIPHQAHFSDFSGGTTTARRMGERREVFGRRKDGSDFPAEASISKVEVEGRRFFTAILRDVTERKAAEAVIRASLAEKEVLLKEIHHRVKNNLQVVSSLLGLQARAIPDSLTRKMFQESQNRVHSMALIHERLYQAENLSEIDFPAYLNELASHLFRSYGVSESRVQLKSNIEQVRLTIDAAVPCGLIINELISNSLKYAFPDGRNGEIRIDLRNAGDGMVKLAVADNGVGLPDGVSLWSSKSLGLRLVRTLSEQLGATVEMRSSQGAEIEVTFQPTPEAARK